jgi:transposase
MNDVMKILYQRHQGAGIKGITRSLGYDRKTVRRYVRAAQDVGFIGTPTTTTSLKLY